jgi:hypothetical protein
MAIRRARETLGRILFQRCLYLFAVLLAMIAIVPFVESTPQGRLVIGLINAFVVIAAVAAVGRSVLSFVIVPVLRQAHAICVVQQLIGSLFLATMIARLAGVHPPQRRRERE